VAHQNKLLAAARAGEQRDDSTVYDGSDGAKSYQAISFIGERKEPQDLPSRPKAPKRWRRCPPGR
jgi:hypothetical protein